MKTQILPVVLGLLSACVAQAQSLLVDRGLPVTNLNATAGAERCNWGVDFGIDTDPSGVYYYMAADSCNLGDPFGGDVIKVDTIRVWVVPAATVTITEYKLLLGTGVDSQLRVAATMATGTPVKYANGVGYQPGDDPAGATRDLLQFDFPVNRVFPPNTRLFFALSGANAAGAFDPPAVHVTNAQRSGVTQQGSDNLVHWFYAPVADLGTWLFGGDFDSNGHPIDKSVDVNVQVFGGPLFGPGEGLRIAITPRGSAIDVRTKGAGTGDTLVFQTSVDLVEWTTAETRTADEVVETFTEANAGEAPRRFYRVVRTMPE